MFNLLIGSFMLLYGIFSVYLRFAHPEKFGKLGPMKERFGERVGTIIHVVGYTLVPLVCGSFLLFKHFNP